MKGETAMAQKIRADTRRLRKMKTENAGRTSRIRKQTERIRNDMKELDGIWEGDAHTVFQKQFALRLGELESLCGKLDRIVKEEEYAAAEYDRCRKKAAGLVRTL